MRLAAVAVAACVGLAVGAAALPLSLLRRRGEELGALRAAPADAPPEQFFEQRVDHFDWDVSTWKQRFWTSDRLCKSPANGCPIFLSIGGEASESVYSVLEGEMVELAEQHGAFIVALEHRFYGASLPKPDLTVESLRLLSSQQALADLANFVRHLRETSGLTDPETSPLVTFGGSYPGALSAWARLKYPHVVHAAVSTSSPVTAELDFTGYCDVVADALSAPIAGGSDACYSATKAAFADFHQRLNGSPEQLSRLSQQLRSCKPLAATENDRFAAVSQWAGEVMGLVQYNSLYIPKGSTRLNVARFCGNMTSAPQGQELDYLVNLMAPQSGCVENTWDEQMQVLVNTTADPAAGGVGARQWTWQTATQFSYYQTCEQATACPFAPDMDLSGYGRQAEQAFGVSLDSTREAVRSSIDYYGSNTTAATRTFFVNGGLDPWHVLSVQRPLPSEGDVRAVVIDGTSHCRQMRPSSPTDPKQVVEAREKVATAIAEWLKQ